MSSLVGSHPQMRVCAQARDVPEARRLCTEQRPDVVVVGLGLRRGWGLDLLRELPRLHRGVRLMAVAERPDESLLRRALRAGALAVATTNDTEKEIFSGLDAVGRGEVWASELAGRALLQQMRDARPEGMLPGLERFSDREIGVFELLGEGMGPTGIARELGVAVKTVETYQRRMKEKLGIESGEQLLARARVWGDLNWTGGLSQPRLAGQRPRNASGVPAPRGTS
jgi:DNA-binding NarL/FixJ family response regulator